MIPAARPDLVILCYHAVCDDWPSVGAIETAALDRQLRHLLKRRYRPLTLSEALTRRPAGRAFVVTFDDAFRSVLDRGLPILERLGVPATVFVPTDFANEALPMTWSNLGKWIGTRFERELSCMSWDDLRSLSDAGWEIGSHTCSHPDLTTVHRDAAAVELERSKEACEAELQCACSSLAYPFGAHDRDVAALAGAAGYERAVTLGSRLVGARIRDQALELSREGIYRTTRWPHFLAATSPLIGRARGLRLYRCFASH